MAANTKPGAAPAVAASTAGDITLTLGKDEPRIDSRLLAANMGKAHHDLFELFKDHCADFEELGVVRFQTDKPTGANGGRPERYALLNEDQSYLLLTYTRNTARTRQIKIKLVKAFSEARRAAQSGIEYLPTYHALHAQLHALAGGSPNEKYVHMNVNKLVNRAVGIGAGERGSVSAAPKAMLIVAQTVAANALRGAYDHHDGYQRAKSALVALSGATLLGA